jgi:general stress protein 26
VDDEGKCYIIHSGSLTLAKVGDMGRSDSLTINDVYSYISDNQYVYMATTQDMQPKVRPMVLFFVKGKFYIVTFSGDSKVAQIKSNKLCEVLLPIKDELDNTGYVKMTGIAKLCVDMNVKMEAEYFCYFFDQFYDGADDPDFCLIELIFETFEVVKPGENHKQVVRV